MLDSLLSSKRASTIIFIGVLIVLFYVIIFGLIFMDLWSGVNKAKQRGEIRTSWAYKKTIDKVNRYFNLLLALNLADAIQISVVYFVFHEYGWDIIMLPFFSFIGTCYEAFVEVTSILEPASVKEEKKQKDFSKLLFTILKDNSLKESVIKALQENP